MSQQHRKEAIKELIFRYRDAWEFWWQHRNEIKILDLKAQEAEFLPSALALQEMPVSPVGRLVAKIIMLLLVTLLGWSVFGKIDIIVMGQGKIIAGGYTKAIASVEVAKVVALYVDEGQRVKAGDLLIELDARAPQSELNKADGDRQLALLQIERSKAFIRAINSDQAPKLPVISGVDKLLLQNEKKHLQDLWRDYVAKRTRIRSQVKRFSEALSLATQTAKDYADLVKQHDVSEHVYAEKEQARIELQGQLDDAKTQLATLTTDLIKTAQAELYQAQGTWSGAVQDGNKANAHSDQLRILSPIDGVVQQLTVHTIGGVVPAAQTLMMIVPDQQKVELEAYIENKDIGFTREGQSAQVKVDAYEYSKYGTVPATVTHVSRDAVDFSGNGTGQFGNNDIDSKNNQKSGKGLMYAIKVSLQKPTINIDGKEMPLSPGMAGSVEIKTGERRLIEYVLSPLITHTHESLHER